MAYPDGPSPSDEANNWFKRTFGKTFGQDYQGVGDAISNVFKPWSNTGTINWDGPEPGHPLGMIRYRGPQQEQERKPFHWPAGEQSVNGQTALGNTSDSRYVDDARDRAMAGREGMGANVVTQQDRQGSLFDDLLRRGTSKWSGVDKSQIDFSPLDKILASRMGLIDQITGQTKTNADKSDVALESMHRGLQNEMNTKGVSRYNSIADNAKKQLQGSANESSQMLQKIKNDDMAKRAAMLKSLGIQEAGGAVDHSADTLTATQANIGAHAADDVALNEQDRASNLAYNQGIVSSVGQQGVERRADLQQQLQQVLGKLGMAKTEYQNQDAQQRMQLERDAEQRQYSEFNNERSYAMDQANSMEDRAFQQQQALAKGLTAKTQGYSGLAADLQNTGYDPQTIQHAMGALSNVLGSEYMKGVNPQEYNQTAVIARRLREAGVPEMVASQLATNYGNLGSTSSY